MSAFLCDTSIISELMRPQPQLTVREWLSLQENINLSVITVEEIYYGLAYKQARRQMEWFEKFLYLRAKILPITPVIARRCGLSRTQADLLIAATAETHNLVLATRNTRDFDGCGLQLINPFSMPTS